MSLTIIANFVAFQVAWFVTVIGAAQGYTLLGVVAVALWVSVYWYWQPQARSDWILLLWTAGVGVVADSLLTISGSISFPVTTGSGYPTTLWMVALWINLGACLRHSMGWLRNRYVLGLVCGALGGPAVYLAGQALMALHVHLPVTVACVWAMAMPGLIWLEQHTRPPVSLVPEKPKTRELYSSGDSL